MLLYIRFAWRNLWRNKRRTAITAASVFAGVVLCSFLTSMQEGSYQQYINTIVNFHSGYIQIHQKGYWDDKQINNSFYYTEKIDSLIKNNPGITYSTLRVESYALVSNEDISRGVFVIGIQSDNEDNVTNISKRVKKGEYLKSGDNGVLIGTRLASYIKLNIGDTLVMISQGYHGTSAAGKFPIKGIIKHPSPEFDKQIVYMEIEQCREFYSLYDMATSAVIMIKEGKEVEEIQNQLKEQIGPDYDIMNWKEMNETLLDQIESDRVQGWFMKGILYMIIGFGILGTIMMMIAERMREFGVLTASGMKKNRLAMVVVIESIFIGMIGVVIGILFSVPIVEYFTVNPIPLTGKAAEMIVEMGFDPKMHFSNEAYVYLEQAIIVFFISLLMSVYSILKIKKLKTVKALRS